jgi:hypothetical protein
LGGAFVGIVGLGNAFDGIAPPLANRPAAPPQRIARILTEPFPLEKGHGKEDE